MPSPGSPIPMGIAHIIKEALKRKWTLQRYFNQWIAISIHCKARVISWGKPTFTFWKHKRKHTLSFNRVPKSESSPKSFSRSLDADPQELAGFPTGVWVGCGDPQYASYRVRREASSDMRCRNEQYSLELSMLEINNEWQNPDTWRIIFMQKKKKSLCWN